MNIAQTTQEGLARTGDRVCSAVPGGAGLDSAAELRGEAVRLLRNYSLQNAARLLPVLSHLQQVCQTDAARYGNGGAADSPQPGGSNGRSAGEDLLVPLSRVVKDHIIRVYEAMGCNKTRAARVLEIDIKTLYNKLKRYGHR